MKTRHDVLQAAGGSHVLPQEPRGASRRSMSAYARAPTSETTAKALLGTRKGKTQASSEGRNSEQISPTGRIGLWERERSSMPFDEI